MTQYLNEMASVGYVDRCGDQACGELAWALTWAGMKPLQAAPVFTGKLRRSAIRKRHLPLDQRSANYMMLAWEETGWAFSLQPGKQKGCYYSIGDATVWRSRIRDPHVAKYVAWLLDATRIQHEYGVYAFPHGGKIPV